MVPANLAGDLEDLEGVGLEGVVAQGEVVGVDEGGDVVRDPAVDLRVDVLRVGRAADVVAHDALDVVRDSRNRERVREIRHELRVLGVLRILELVRLLDRLNAEEHGVGRALLVDHRNQPGVRQLQLPEVGHRDLDGRAELLFPTEVERVGGQSGDEATAFDTAQVLAPEIGRAHV